MLTSEGFISKTELRQGIESKVNVKLASKILDEIFRRADRRLRYFEIF
jgi:hypothetical protein